MTLRTFWKWQRSGWSANVRLFRRQRPEPGGSPSTLVSLSGSLLEVLSASGWVAWFAYAADK